jgi:hypothetical protein
MKNTSPLSFGVACALANDASDLDWAQANTETMKPCHKWLCRLTVRLMHFTARRLAGDRVNLLYSED